MSVLRLMLKPESGIGQSSNRTQQGGKDGRRLWREGEIEVQARIQHEAIIETGRALWVFSPDVQRGESSEAGKGTSKSLAALLAKLIVAEERGSISVRKNECLGHQEKAGRFT